MMMLLLGGCTAEKKTPGTIGIGGIGPLTGSEEAYGNAVKNGAQLAIEEINALGGVQFELNFKDDENNASKTVEAYDALKEWGLQVLLGAATAEPCIRVVDLADRDGIFTVTPSASTPEITLGHDNVFRVSYNDMGQGKAAASYIASNGLSQRIGVIYKSDDVYSKGVYDAFKAEADRLELEVVSVCSFSGKKTADFKDHLKDAMEKEVDLLFLPVYYEPAAKILTQAAELEYSPLFFGTDGVDGIFSVTEFDKTLAEGLHLLSPIPADFSDDQTRQFMEEYQSRYGELPNQFAADAYDAVYAIYEAAKAASVTADMTAEEMCAPLCEAMKNLELNGITGAGNKLTWNEDGEVDKEPIVVVVQSGMYVKK